MIFPWIVVLVVVFCCFVDRKSCRATYSKFPIFSTLENQMSQAFNDAFAAYVAARDAQEAKAVADAVAAATNDQTALDAAKAAGAQEESDADVAVVQAATGTLSSV